jgi:tetratricopeptide (TPR) repeat protein
MESSKTKANDHDGDPLLLMISIIHTFTTPEVKKVANKDSAVEENQPSALIRTLPDVLSSDNVKRIKALLYEIDNVIGAGGLSSEMQGLLYGAKGRLYLSLARMEKELAHLHFLHYQNLRRMRPKEAKIALNEQRTTVKQAENFFSKAQVSIGTANEAAGAHPLTLLAKADKNAYEGGMDLMRMTLQKARTLGQQYQMDAVIHYEAKVIAGLGDSLKSMEDKELRLVIDAGTNLHILLNGKWYQDKRIVYLSMALGLLENTLQTLPNFTRIDHLRQGMDVFSNENPTHERARLITAIAKDILPKKNPSKESRTLSKIERNVDKIRSLRLKGKHRKAVKKLMAMAKKYPREVAPVGELGWAYLDINKPEKALSYFNEAVRISPTHVISNYGRAEAFRLSGKPHQALEAYERFLSISPQGPEARAARNSIDVIIETIEMSGRNQKYRINKMQKRAR